MKKKSMSMLLALTLTAALLTSCGDTDSKSEAKTSSVIDGELDFSWNADNGDQANARFVKN